MKKLSYPTITQPFTYEIPKIKGSRFFGTLFPVKTKEEAEQYLHNMKKNFYDATHHCSAYRIGVHMHQDLFGNILIDPKRSKANDDGEPSNTAGKPLLSVLEGYQLHNILLVATRYFGGTLLGVGGLIQAYTQTAQETVKHAPLIQQEIVDTLEITYDYQQTSLLAHLFEKYEVKVLTEYYDDKIHQKLQINYGLSEAFTKEVWEKSQGKIKGISVN